MNVRSAKAILPTAMQKDICEARFRAFTIRGFRFLSPWNTRAVLPFVWMPHRLSHLSFLICPMIFLLVNRLPIRYSLHHLGSVVSLKLVTVLSLRSFLLRARKRFLLLPLPMMVLIGCLGSLGRTFLLARRAGRWTKVGSSRSFLAKAVFPDLCGSGGGFFFHRSMLSLKGSLNHLRIYSIPMFSIKFFVGVHQAALSLYISVPLVPRTAWRAVLGMVAHHRYAR